MTSHFGYTKSFLLLLLTKVNHFMVPKTLYSECLYFNDKKHLKAEERLNVYCILNPSILSSWLVYTSGPLLNNLPICCTQPSLSYLSPLVLFLSSSAQYPVIFSSLSSNPRLTLPNIPLVFLKCPTLPIST